MFNPAWQTALEHNAGLADASSSVRYNTLNTRLIRSFAETSESAIYETGPKFRTRNAYHVHEAAKVRLCPVQLPFLSVLRMYSPMLTPTWRSH